MRKADVLAFFDGHQATVARFLKIPRQRVHEWPEVIPETYAWRLDYLTRGALPIDVSLYLNGRSKPLSYQELEEWWGVVPRKARGRIPR